MQLLADDAVLTKIHAELVPARVPYEVFWQRYYFRTSRASSLGLGGGGDSSDDEDLGWDEEDDDDDDDDDNNGGGSGGGGSGGDGTAPHGSG